MKKWTDIEIKILKTYYPRGGVKACIDKLCRTDTAIKSKACEIGVVVYGIQGGSKKLIIKKLKNNRAIAFCMTHGKVMHYHKSERLRCVKCESEQFQKWSKKASSKIKMRDAARVRLTKPINIYKNRLRSTLHHCSRGTISFTKHLQYSSKELHNHLETIKLKQNNQCPMCNANYDDVGFDIDHIIPTSSASNKSELLALFDLENLSLLCPNCNRYIKSDKILGGLYVKL